MSARTTIRPRYVVVTLACLLLSVAVPFSLPFLAQLQIPNAVLLGIALTSLVFLVVYARVLTSCHRWVELDGNRLMASRLLTGRVQEWKVQDIVTVTGVGLRELGLSEAVAPETQKRMGGYVIEFGDGTKLILSRHEMITVDAFLLALADRIKQEFVETRSSAN